MKKEKLLPKIVASVALFAIIIGIVWTGVLIVFETFFATAPTPSLTEQELKEYLETLSGATLSGASLSGATLPIPEVTSGTGS